MEHDTLESGYIPKHLDRVVYAVFLSCSDTYSEEAFARTIVRVFNLQERVPCAEQVVPRSKGRAVSDVD